MTMHATVRQATAAEGGAPCGFFGCDRLLVPSGRAGRPALYCSEECREAFKLIGRLEAVARTVAARATCEDTLRRLCGDVTSALNSAVNPARARLRRERAAATSLVNDSQDAPRVSGAETVAR